MREIDGLDRAAIEGLYPPSAYEEDIARNAAGDADARHGIRIEPASATGRFRLVRARQGIAEAPATEGSLFVAPDAQHRFAGLMQSDARYGGPVETGDELDAARRRGEGHAAFIARLQEIMRSMPALDPVGRGEERLKGFHGG